MNPVTSALASIQRPTSRGKVWIDSADPAAAPKFRFNYLSTDYDKEVALAAVRATQELFQQAAWRGRLTSELSGVQELRSDSDYHEVGLRPCGV